MKIKLLFCLMVFQSAMLFGMEPDKNKSGNNDVLKGSIFIVGKPFYSLYHCKLLNDIFSTTVGKGNPIVEVCIDNEKVPNWSTVGFTEFRKTHPEYQEYLNILSKLKTLNGDVNELTDDEQKLFQDVCDRKAPPFIFLSFLDRKKEGEYVAKRMFGVPVKLKCEGVKDPNNKNAPMMPFHVGLQKLKADFAKKPNYLPKEEERLVKEEILVKNWLIKKWWTGNTHSHGTNSSIVKNQKN